MSIGGEFWIPHNPERRVRGEFIAELGGKPQANLTANLVDDQRVIVDREPGGGVTGWSVSAEATRSVASFLPTTLHGQLDNGKPVTLVDAQNYGRAGYFRPRYVTNAGAIVGALVSKDQLYSSVRFRMDRPYSLTHLVDGESSEVADDDSRLRVEAAESEDWASDNWLVYESARGDTLRQLEVRVVSGCLALLQLAMYPDEDRKTRETQIRIDPHGDWLEVHGPAFCAELSEFENQPLLKPDQLSIETYAKWIALHTKLDGLTWVVARPFMGAAQTRVLLLATLIEGFHRSLPGYEQSKFPGVAKRALRQIFEAARRAAVTQASVDGIESRLVEKAITFYREVSFQERAQAIVTEVCSAVPEITESITELSSRITKARNSLAHHLDAEAPLEDRVLEWLIVSGATSWLLRCLLLLRVDIDPQLLHTRLLMFQRFAFFRANTAQHVQELGWDVPSPN
ncbi:HEPN domain-containing protein [Mycobacterium sherrisii]|uniref:HEPN domain-containing protein n=1 Tax=Mycobacterium sherrisii TaxID=243061 RepID=UPI002DDD9DEE|nr:HEPN domain-containing protein [Mycobacterium sherrisii]MEC4765140.1 HEPN domain-containing protein [Mycobacterium sherrisii]